MKTAIALIVFLALCLAPGAFAQSTITQHKNDRNQLFIGERNELSAGSTLVLSGNIKSGATTLGVPFMVTGTITSAAAVTPVVILPDAAVGAARKVYVTGFHAKVNGTTVWATTATVKLQDTNGSAIDFMTAAVAALTSQAFVGPFTANITPAPAFTLGTGGTLGKGLQLKGDANGTGSSLVVTVTGYIK